MESLARCGFRAEHHRNTHIKIKTTVGYISIKTGDCWRSPALKWQVKVKVIYRSVTHCLQKIKTVKIFSVQIMSVCA